MLDYQNFSAHYLRQLGHGLEAIARLAPEITRAIGIIERCRATNGTVWLFGNGGSAALASHIATDLQLAGIRAVALTDVSAITTYANDDKYDAVFSKQLRLLSRPGDVAIGISGSGSSPNIFDALIKKLPYDVTPIAVLGQDGGVVKISASARDVLVLHIPSGPMGVSQDCHQIVLHMIAYYLMANRC